MYFGYFMLVPLAFLYEKPMRSLFCFEQQFGLLFHSWASSLFVYKTLFIRRTRSDIPLKLALADLAPYLALNIYSSIYLSIYLASLSISQRSNQRAALSEVDLLLLLLLLNAAGIHEYSAGFGRPLFVFRPALRRRRRFCARGQRHFRCARDAQTGAQVGQSCST